MYTDAPQYKKLPTTSPARSRQSTSESALPTGAINSETTTPKPSGMKPGSELEAALLLHLKALKLDAGLHQEWRFHAKRKWRFDFAWPGMMVACEVEGGHWIGGRHQRGAGFDADAEKYNEAALDGWRVIRVTSTHIKSGAAVEWIRRALNG